MRLVLRAAAARDLDGVFDYSVAVHGVGSAERYLRDLQTGVDRLRDHTALGMNTRLGPGVRALGAREHRIYYRVAGEAILWIKRCSRP